MKTTQKSKTPTKSNPQFSQEQPLVLIHQNSLKILLHETSQQITKYLIENKLTSFALKNQKCLTILNISLQLFKTMLVQNQDSDQFLNRVIGHYRKNGKKVYDFCRCLRHFGEKNYEFQYIQAVAKGQNQQSLSFYMKCRSMIIDSFLNKAKRELLIGVIGDEQQWFKVVKKIFKNVREEHIIELFTDTIKYHYLNIKKNQNQLLNGAEIYRICQIINRNLKDSQNQLYSFDERDQIQMNASKANDQNYQQRESLSQKQKQVKRLFEKNVVDGLQAEDRELIRILSYKDNNIARLLQKKHEKMIEIIAEQVDAMRRSIEVEKKKYLQLWQQKQQIARTADTLNFLSLAYISNDTIQNQEKLFRAIQSFNGKFKNNSQTTNMIKKMRESKKNKRLIELIQKQEKQKC